MYQCHTVKNACGLTCYLGSCLRYPVEFLCTVFMNAFCFVGLAWKCIYIHKSTWTVLYIHCSFTQFHSLKVGGSNAPRNIATCQQRQRRRLWANKHLQVVVFFFKIGFQHIYEEMHSRYLVNLKHTHNVFWWETVNVNINVLFFFFLQENSTGYLITANGEN